MPADIAPELPEKKVYPVIDEGVYQALIVDVESGKQKPYDLRLDPKAPETEPFYVFKFKILTPGPAQGRLLWSKRSKAVLPVPPEGKMKPSLVWRIASAVAGHQITFDEGKTWTLAQINALAGKQIILVVERTAKQGGEGGEMNTINTYMHAREVLPDVDENMGGAETPPTTTAPITETPAAPAATAAPAQDIPDRLKTVPQQFWPEHRDGSSKQAGV